MEGEGDGAIANGDDEKEWEEADSVNMFYYGFSRWPIVYCEHIFVICIVLNYFIGLSWSLHLGTLWSHFKHWLEYRVIKNVVHEDGES